MTNVYDMSPDASDDEDFAPLPTEEFEPFVDLQTLLTRPAHLSIFLNYAIGENKPNNLVGERFLAFQCFNTVRNCRGRVPKFNQSEA